MFGSDLAARSACLASSTCLAAKRAERITCHRAEGGEAGLGDLRPAAQFECKEIDTNSLCANLKITMNFATRSKTGFKSTFFIAAALLAGNAHASAPSVQQPQQGAVVETNAPLTVRWSGLGAAGIPASFDLFVRDAVSKSIVWRDSAISSASHCDALGDCSLDVPVSLAEARNHYLRIRSEDGSGYSSWSAVRRFDVLAPDREAPDTPILILPARNSSVSLGSSIDVSYRLQANDNSLRDPSTFDFLIFDSELGRVVYRESGVGGVQCNIARVCSVNISPPLSEGNRRYVLRVRAENVAGVSAWSGAHRFSVSEIEYTKPDAPVVTSPASKHEFSATDPLTFKWQLQAGQQSLDVPTEYDAFIYDLDSRSIVWRDRQISASVHCDEASVCRLDVAATLAATESYIFRVKAINRAGASPWSSSRRFGVSEQQDLVVTDSCTAAAGVISSYSASVAPSVSGGHGPFTFELSGDASRGTVDLDYHEGSFVYYPADNGRGYLEGFDVKIRDQSAQEAIVHVSFVFGSRRIMPLGDSITFGVENYNSVTGDYPLSANAVGYRKRLKELLVAGGYDTQFVGPRSSGSSAGLDDSQHAGYPGWTSLHIANGRPGYSSSGHLGQWLNDHAADVLLLHAGTNDHSTSSYGVSQILERADTWRLNNNVPLLTLAATLIDQRRDHWNRSHLEFFNSAVTQEVAATDSARLVDMYPVLDWESDLTTYPTDITGLHPNAGGYLKMADKWYQGLVEEGLLHKCPQ